MILTERTLNGGTQVVHKFTNGYGASVLSGGTYTYGGDEGLKELAVIKFYDGDRWHLCYETEITDDVLGYLTDEEVADILVQIEALEATNEIIYLYMRNQILGYPYSRHCLFSPRSTSDEKLV